MTDQARPSGTRGMRPPHSTSPIRMSVLTQSQRSGRKIIEILEKNPKTDPSKYDEDDLAHMRRVVAYCKRHLVQVDKAKQNPDSKSAVCIDFFALELEVGYHCIG